MKSTADVYELDQSKFYLLVINRETHNAGVSERLHDSLQKAGVRSIIIITEDTPESAVAVFEETNGCTT